MTTLTDSFDRADAGSLGTASGGFSWTEVAGSNSISSNLATGTTGGDLSRAESDLSSEDHYVQAVIKNATPNNIGLCARFAAAAQTFYLLQVSGGDTVKIYKCVTGAFTELASTGSLSFIDTDVIKLECISTAIKGYQNGVERVSVTDSAISGNTRTGIRMGATSQFIDSFEAGDTGGVAPTLMGAICL